jgi:DNA-binding GntR family transcriptional regulator
MLGLIAAEVARLATDEEIAELRVLLREMERTAGTSDRDGYYWGNVTFHERFADLARNKTLKRILESLALRSLRLRRLTLSSAGRMQRSLADHTRLVGALEDRDGELASALIKANVLGALKLLEQLLADGDKARDKTKDKTAS